MTKKEMVELWHETQVGHYKKCRDKQIEFSDMMWKLYYELTDLLIISDEQENTTTD